MGFLLNPPISRVKACVVSRADNSSAICSPDQSPAGPRRIIGKRSGSQKVAHVCVRQWELIWPALRPFQDSSSSRFVLVVVQLPIFGELDRTHPLSPLMRQPFLRVETELAPAFQFVLADTCALLPRPNPSHSFGRLRWSVERNSSPQGNVKNCAKRIKLRWKVRNGRNNQLTEAFDGWRLRTDKTSRSES